MTSENGESIIVGYPKATKIWNLNAWTCEKSLRLHTRDVTSMILLSKTHFVSGSLDGFVHIVNRGNGRVEHTFKVHTDGVKSLAFVPDFRIVTGSKDRTVKVINIETGKVESTFSGHSKHVSSVANLHENRIASGSWDKTIRIWDLESKDCVRILEGHELAVSCIIYFPTEVDEKLVSGSNDKTVRVWDIQTGKCLHTYEGHTGYVTGLCRLGARRLISSSKDNTVRVWDIFTNECLRVLKGHKQHVNCVIRLDNDRFISGSSDQTTKIWSSSSGRCQSTKNHDAQVTSLLLVKTEEELRSDEEKDYRQAYVEEQCPDFVFKLENGGEIRFFKSLLINSTLDFPESEWTLTEEHAWVFKHLDPTYILQLFLGERSTPEDSEFLELYCLFKELRMPDYMLCLIRVFKSRARPLTETLRLCERCLNELEKDIDYSKATLPEFKSALTTSVFNVLKKNYQKIFSSEKLLNMLVKLKISKQVMAYAIRPVTRHPDFRGYSVPRGRFSDFKGLFNKWTKKLFMKKAYPNLFIKTSDSEEAFAAHKEILVLKSNYFFQFFNRLDRNVEEEDKEAEGEGESDEEGSNVVRISSLSHNEMGVLLEFLYTSRIRSNDMKSLLNLLQHAQSFNELDLRLYIFGRIKEVSSEYFQNNELETKLLEFGYLFQGIDESIENALFDFWGNVFGIRIEVLTKVVEESVVQQQIKDKLEEDETAILEMKSSLNDTIEILKLKEKDLEQERSRNDSLNQSFQLEKDEMTGGIDQLRIDLKDRDETIEEKEEKLRKALVENDILNEDLKSKKVIVEDRDQKIIERDAIIEEKKGNILQLETEILTLGEQLETEKRNLEKQSSQHEEDLRKAKEDINSELSEKDEEIKSVLQEKEELEEALHSDLMKKMEQIDKLETKLTKTELSLEKAEGANTKLSKKNKKMKKTNASLSDESVQTKVELDEEKKKNLEEVNKLESRIEDLEKKNARLKGENDDQGKDLLNLQNELEDLESKYGGTEDMIKKLEESKKELEKVKFENEDVITKQTDEIASLTDELKKFRNDYNVLKKQSKKQEIDSRNRVKKIEKNIGSQKTRIQQIEAEVNRGKKQIAKLIDQLEAEKDNKQKIKEQGEVIRKKKDQKLVEERTKYGLLKDEFEMKKDEMIRENEEFRKKQKEETEELREELEEEHSKIEKKMKREMKRTELAKSSISRYKKLVIFLIFIFVLNLAINVFYIVHNFGGGES